MTPPSRGNDKGSATWNKTRSYSRLRSLCANLLNDNQEPGKGPGLLQSPSSTRGQPWDAEEHRTSPESVKHIKTELPSVSASTDRENWGYLWRENIVASHMSPWVKIRKKDIHKFLKTQSKSFLSKRVRDTPDPHIHSKNFSPYNCFWRSHSSELPSLSHHWQNPLVKLFLLQCQNLLLLLHHPELQTDLWNPQTWVIYTRDAPACTEHTATEDSIRKFQEF